MNPLFDFNGDGRMDMLEFLMATDNDPDNPRNSESTSFNKEFDDYDETDDNE